MTPLERPGTAFALLALLTLAPAHATASEPDPELVKLAERHPATRPGEVFVYAHAERSRGAAPKRFDARPILSSPWDRPNAPPAWHVIDGLCFGDAAVSAQWLAAVRAETKAAAAGEAILDMLADWSADSCPTFTPCRYAAGKAAVEKERAAAAHLWEVAAECPDPTLTPLFEASAPSHELAMHLWTLQLHDVPVPWRTRYERLIPDALEEVARATRRGEEPSWFRVTHAAEVVAAIRDPAAMKALRAARASATSRDAKDAIGTGFVAVRGDPPLMQEAKAIFEAACRNPVHAETCASLQDRVSRAAAERPLTELIDDERFDPRAWANTDQRRTELLRALGACDSDSCLHHLAELDWKLARERARQLHAAREKEAGGEHFPLSELEQTLERFDSRDAVLAYLKKAGLVAPELAAGPTDVTAHDLLRRGGRLASFDLDDDEQISPAPNDHVLRHVLVRLAGIRDARVLQTSGKKDEAEGIARCELSVWLGGERFREPFLCDDELQYLPVAAVANTLLEARGSDLRVTPTADREIVIGPKAALATAVQEGLLEAWMPDPEPAPDENGQDEQDEHE